METIIKDMERRYPLPPEASAQSVAYALTEFLDVKKNMITQMMRTKSGYVIQCKGDAEAEWTKYIGADVALSITLEQADGELKVTIAFEKWLEKLGIAALGAVFLHPLLLTAGVGALRQITLPQDIYNFIESSLHVEPIEEKAERINPEPEPETYPQICPHCGTVNRPEALFCRECGKELLDESEEHRCPNCDGLLDGDEKFCPYCGAPLK